MSVEGELRTIKKALEELSSKVGEIYELHFRCKYCDGSGVSTRWESGKQVEIDCKFCEGSGRGRQGRLS